MQEIKIKRELFEGRAGQTRKCWIGCFLTGKSKRTLILISFIFLNSLQQVKSNTSAFPKSNNDGFKIVF
jgi:hypothetical protein